VTLAWIDQDQLARLRAADVLAFAEMEDALGHDHGNRNRVAVLRHALAGQQPQSDHAHGAAVPDLLPTEGPRLHPGRNYDLEVPASIRLLARADVERLLDLDALIEALADAFRKLSSGEASVPPRIAASNAGGLLAAMPGYLPGGGLEVKLVSVFPGNHDRGLPSHQALIALFDENDGSPRAVMDGTGITAIRTGAAAALSVRLLARPEAAVLAVLGAGVQGRAHLKAVPRTRRFSEIRLASKHRDHADALARDFPGVRVAGSFEEAVTGADVVCCCTDSAAPVIRRAWLKPGAHVTSVGASRGGPELGPDVINAGVLCVESRAAFLAYPAGAHELQGLDAERAVELGELVAGTRPGRSGGQDLTVYKSMGHAVEDIAAARLVLDRAIAENAGTLVEL
jgi:alanine dehydrogenase